MGLLIEKTLEEKQAAAKAQILARVSQSVGMIQNQFTAMFASVWMNPELTPQQVFDAMGTDAASLFQLAGLTQNFLNTLKPGLCVQQPPVAYTINQDGTVTVAEPGV